MLQNRIGKKKTELAGYKDLTWEGPNFVCSTLRLGLRFSCPWKIFTFKTCLSQTFLKSKLVASFNMLS